MLELVSLYGLNQKMFIHVLTLISERFVIHPLKLNDSWKNYQIPLKQRENAFEEKSEYFHWVSRFLK